MTYFRACVKSKFYGAFVLNRRVVLHAIDATPARRRGDVNSSPLDRARTAASSPRNAPDALVDFHTGIGMDLFEAKPAKPKRLLGIVEQALAAANGDAAAAAAIAAAATAKACAEAGAAVLEDEAPPAPLGDLNVGEEVELCLCARSGLAWIGVAVTRVRAPGPTYDVAGDVVTASNVARRRLRKPNQTQASLAPGVPVDVAHEGALRPGEVVAVDGDAGTCDVKLADGTPLQGVAAAKVLALHA